MRNIKHKDPTFEAACRMEINQKQCGVCVRGDEVIKDVYVCKVNKSFPACRREVNGFEYDKGDL